MGMAYDWRIKQLWRLVDKETRPHRLFLRGTICSYLGKNSELTGFQPVRSSSFVSGFFKRPYLWYMCVSPLILGGHYQRTNDDLTVTTY
jgi:hypothetical protein